MADRYLAVNVSHDNVDVCVIKPDLSSLLVKLCSRAIRLGTFCCKNCRRKSVFREDFYADDFLMVHKFKLFISLEATQTSLILIQMK